MRREGNDEGKNGVDGRKRDGDFLFISSNSKQAKQVSNQWGRALAGSTTVCVCFFVSTLIEKERQERRCNRHVCEELFLYNIYKQVSASSCSPCFNKW